MQAIEFLSRAVQDFSNRGITLNHKIKQLQASRNANKKRLASLPDSAAELDNKSVDPSNSIKERKSKKQKRS